MEALSALIPLGILAAAGVLLGSTVSGVLRSPPAAPPSRTLRRARSLSVRVTCPMTDRLASVRIGARVGPSGPELAIFRCQRFGEVRPTCGEECLDAAL